MEVISRRSGFVGGSAAYPWVSVAVVMNRVRPAYALVALGETLQLPGSRLALSQGTSWAETRARRS